MSDFSLFDESRLPPAYGLANTGVICYFNSLLQMLAGCTSVAATAAAHAQEVGATLTGRAFLEYLAAPAGQGHTRLLDALRADLAARRPRVTFGAGQESASEALVLLIDMIEPDAAPGDPPAPGAITRLFQHRSRAELTCPACRRVASTAADLSLVMYLGHYTAGDNFLQCVQSHDSETADFGCECGAAASRATRTYRLTMASEILVFAFNMYTLPRGAPLPFPERFELPGDGEPLRYRLVGQVEHSGSLHGGHYWARGLRREGVAMLNDYSVMPSAFAPTPFTYLLAYHMV